MKEVLSKSKKFVEQRFKEYSVLGIEKDYDTERISVHRIHRDK